ncbi:MAG: glycogen/starch/alpha-glucan phosphorylase [Nitrospinae bacterium]|nr:glycogen/starch/alpha-glucan phosphorylase [Nitrospinota bacterium]
MEEKSPPAGKPDKEKTTKTKNEKPPLSRHEVESLKRSIEKHIVYSIAKDAVGANKYDFYNAVAYAIRDLLIERWLKTQSAYYHMKAKRVYYLSMEFLIGRTFGNSLINMGLYDTCHQALHELGYDLEEIREVEWDAGLGNGGLGRLAACFLDSLATMELPSYGYGIHYEYGIFYQRIVDGGQVEIPDNWLRYGNPWEFVRPEHIFPVKFYGSVNQRRDEEGVIRSEWVDAEELMAVACDTPIPGYDNNHVINMRLWAARATREFDLKYFNEGDYIRAMESKMVSESISKVLYPSDHLAEGRELRLKQQYFLVSATLQDIIRRYEKHEKEFDNFPDKVAVQLNDTHPALAIAEFMRVLVDKKSVDWDKAWGITVRTFGYTNHTLLPEALEKWSVSLFERVLPRHLQIIYEINHRFLQEVARRFPGDLDRLGRMSLIEEGGEKKVRMAHLAIVGSHSVNGVSELHSNLLKTQLFKDFDELFPGRFNNKTNGITPRRWLKKCNQGLAGLITREIGDGWAKDLYQLKRLVPLAEDKAFRAEWRAVKQANKVRLAAYIKWKNRLEVDIDSMFDSQVKRMHEYKRQLLNLLHAVTMYNRIRKNPGGDFTPRAVIFGGKAAPAYWIAKLIIKLINSVADVVNNNKDVGGRLKVVFLHNYKVSLAEKIMPATDLSEQISTAGKEASGTGNMKFALNGALTIGTLDGANIEIMEEVGKENIFIFGLNAVEVADLKGRGYNPWDYYNRNAELKEVLDMIGGGYFSPFQHDLFRPIVASLLEHGDPYLLLADYQAYVECQDRVSAAFKDHESWTRMSILNTANMGKFSSDNTIREYAEKIWGVHPVHVE